MKAAISLIICTIFFTQAFSQSFRIDPTPDDINNDSLIKNQHVKKECIYSYNREEKNKDSILLTMKFFNESGFCTEIDNIKDGKIYSSRNFQYVDDKLIKIESQTTGLVGSSIKTFDYDSAGNVIEEKNYTVDSPIVLLNRTTFEYDNIKRISKNHFIGTKYTSYNTFFSYNPNRSLKEVAEKDEDNSFINDFTYEYDSIANTKSEYNFTDYKRLVTQNFYNQSKQLIKELDYNSASFHESRYFQYTNDSLLSFEKIQLINGAKYYFKFYYYK